MFGFQNYEIFWKNLVFSVSRKFSEKKFGNKFGNENSGINLKIIPICMSNTKLSNKTMYWYFMKVSILPWCDSHKPTPSWSNLTKMAMFGQIRTQFRSEQLKIWPGRSRIME